MEEEEKTPAEEELAGEETEKEIEQPTEETEL